MRAIALVICLLGAGPAWAGSDAAFGPAAATGAQVAWVADYRVHDGRGDRQLVLVRSGNRVEYRLEGEPVRVWELGAEGLSHREVFPAERRVVSFTPGDLRALGRDSGWEQLSHLVEPTLRGQLTLRGTVRTHLVPGARMQRYRGEVRQVAVELDWLEAADLPVRYRSGKGKSAYDLELQSLSRQPAAGAFTVTDGLREIDYADIGDMELDPFVQRYVREASAAPSQ